MTNRQRRRKSLIDELFGGSMFDEKEALDEFPESG